jgi:hypothetical protein
MTRLLRLISTSHTVTMDQITTDFTTQLIHQTMTIDIPILTTTPMMTTTMELAMTTTQRPLTR